MPTSRRATATWSGDLPSGHGTVTAATTGIFRDQKTTWASRTGEPEGVTEISVVARNRRRLCLICHRGGTEIQRGPSVLVNLDTISHTFDTGTLILSAAARLLR